MAPKPVTDARAVQRALAEFDTIGRSAFLSKYQFGPARRYFIAYDGKLYDSKAILGAAHGYQYGSPLRHEEFDGGDVGAAEALRRLGFTIEKSDFESVAEPRTLKLGDAYTRREIHDIFSPDTHFQPQRGPWGIWGIVEVPDRPGDYVLLVTLGQSQGDHVFDESITEDGVLSWQSQPQQSLTERRIRDFINHDETVNSIYLFLRTKKTGPYTYFGPLSYLSHDATREKPVYFQWQILHWPPDAGLAERIGLVLAKNEAQESTPRSFDGEITFTSQPPGRSRQGISTKTFRGRKSPQYAERDARNRQLGLQGELAILHHEKRRLSAAGRDDLADRVVHVSVVEGDAAGYDIRSYDVSGQVIYIEVKTTRGPGNTDFFMTSNEVAFSERHPDSYVLYRLYEFDPNSSSGFVYVHRGPLGATHQLLPTQYRARILDNDVTN